MHQTKLKTWTHFPKQICIITGAVVLSRRALHLVVVFFGQKNRTKLKRVGGQHMICIAESDVLTQKHVAICWRSDREMPSSFPRLQLTTVLYFWCNKHCFFSCGSEHECGSKRQPVKGCRCCLFVNVVWKPTYTHAPICSIVVMVSSRVSSSTYRLESLDCINCYALNISILLTMHGGGFLHVWKGKKKSRFHDCYWLEQRTGWQQWLHFPFWLAKEWIYKLKQEQKDVSFNTTGEHKSGSDSAVLIVKF